MSKQLHGLGAEQCNAWILIKLRKSTEQPEGWEEPQWAASPPSAAPDPIAMAVEDSPLAGASAALVWPSSCPAAAEQSPHWGDCVGETAGTAAEKISPLCWDECYSTFTAGPVALQLCVQRGTGPCGLWSPQEQAIQGQVCWFAALQYEKNHLVAPLNVGSASTRLAASVPFLFSFPRKFSASHIVFCSPQSLAHQQLPMLKSTM